MIFEPLHISSESPDWKGIACGALNGSGRRDQLRTADPGAVDTGSQFEGIVKEKAAETVRDEPVAEFAVHSPEDGHTNDQAPIYGKM